MAVNSRIASWVRPDLRAMAAYEPGEQPRDGSYIKLNTNECAYPPSTRVIEAIQEALAQDRLRKYPDPSGTTFRQAAAGVLGVEPDSILIGNGSDDVLTILTRAFVPEGGTLAAAEPGYLLYRTLAEIQGARYVAVPYDNGWRLPGRWPAPDANLTVVASPNSPSGTTVSQGRLQQLAEELGGPLVIDEAYADFADGNALELARTGAAIVTRSLSKSYALAGIRFGFALASPPVLRELTKVKDSYNCDVLSLAAATAAILDQDYFRSIRASTLATRARVHGALLSLSFEVSPSHANFLWCRHAARPAKLLYEELKRRMILVRYMNFPGHSCGLRITIGTDAEMDCLLDELRRLV
jgi:histidinol-phosphate aminotransferase